VWAIGYQRLITVAHNHPPLKEELGLLDHQVAEIKAIAEDCFADRIPEDFVDPNYAKIIFATSEGKLEPLKKEIRRKLDIAKERESKMCKRVVEEVLLPAQREQIRSLAKFTRWIYESKVGDEFGGAIAWSKSVDIAGFDESAFEKTVLSARKEYYAQLTELRKDSAQELFQALPDSAQEKFRSLYGEFYDLHAERVQSWDELRESNR
jgi:hypothetical protein